LTACIRQAHATGACILGVPVVDTLKRVNENGDIEATIKRDGLWHAQTPQAFGYDLIKSAHAYAKKNRLTATDDALLVERYGHRVKMIPGSHQNIKITTHEDLALAVAICRTGKIEKGV
jgi:2-C-methyl-D-erythritol 4-phosphate cytidylyltransferase